MNIVFFGTSDYCLPILETLNSNFELKLVVTRPDKPIGRKKELTPSATKIWATSHNIPVITPATLKKDTPDRLALIDATKKVRPFQGLGEAPVDLAVVSDYGLIIPEAIFTMPKNGTINVHFSKLPDLRGPSPVQFTLLRGDDEAWITIFKLENPPELEIKMDSGPIIFQKSYPILSDDTTESLYTRLFEKAAHELTRTIKSLDINPNLKLTHQDHSKATFCRFLTKEDGYLSETVLSQAIAGVRLKIEDLPKIQQEALGLVQSSEFRVQSKKTINYVYNFYQAVTPWPGLWTLRHAQGKSQRMKILKCHLEKDKLVLDEVQFEGKNPTKFA